ncbi:MAG: septal ring lytic transglycosylase RlpA family protein [Nitrospiraceae bacterium]
MNAISLDRRVSTLLAGVLLVGLSGCSVLSKGVVTLDVGQQDRGVASWYGESFHGRLAADGKIFDMYALTGAHRTLPLGTVVRVVNAVNGRSVLIRITDRGPYIEGRMLDLSYAAAERLGMTVQGLSPVLVDVVGSHDLLVQHVRIAVASLETAVGWNTNMERVPSAHSVPSVEALIPLRPGDVWGGRRERRWLIEV